MKNTKSFKLIVLITVLSLVLSAMAGIAVFAEDESVAEVTVDGANIAYNEMMHMAINLKCTEELSEGAVLGLLIWDDTVEGDLNAENATYATFTEKVDENGTKYFRSQAIPAPKMGDEFKLAGCIKEADGTVRIGKIVSYSIAEYLNDRINTPGISAEQLDLYQKTLAYGKAAGAVFAD